MFFKTIFTQFFKNQSLNNSFFFKYNTIYILNNKFLSNNYINGIFIQFTVELIPVLVTQDSCSAGNRKKTIKNIKYRKMFSLKPETLSRIKH